MAYKVMKFDTPKKYIKPEPKPVPKPEPEGEPEQLFEIPQEGSKPWITTKSEIQKRVTNLTAKADAIVPGDEPEDQESKEWSEWLSLSEKKLHYVDLAGDFQLLLNNVNKLP